MSRPSSGVAMDGGQTAGRCESVAHKVISLRETIASSSAAIEVPGKTGHSDVTARTEEGKSLRSPTRGDTDPGSDSRRWQTPPIRDVSRLGGFLRSGAYVLQELRVTGATC